MTAFSAMVRTIAYLVVRWKKTKKNTAVVVSNASAAAFILFVINNNFAIPRQPSALLRMYVPDTQGINFELQQWFHDQTTNSLRPTLPLSDGIEVVLT